MFREYKIPALFLSAGVLFSLLTSSCKEEPPPAPLPFADFLVSNNGCLAPCWIYFYDNSQNAVKWEWDFGNNFNSTTQNDSMLYQSQGYYDVSLRIENSDGVADSVSKEVFVYE
ncbi:MAG: PKD domain-containing protein [Crocinitomicaceae bacterium]|nr:PKD domain-containing protein [Crocinitomicaceae bacterium]